MNKSLPPVISNQVGAQKSTKGLRGQQIIEHGKIRVRLTAVILIWFIAFICVLGGLYQAIFNPQQSKELWLVLVPLISAAFSGLVALGLGQKHQE
ncbi:MAG: hypothetical protein HZB59_02820 [Ignavibacteriales bacterium]|nr:hypothetical protein [Ignavibacteriales bacterium]